MSLLGYLKQPFPYIYNKWKPVLASSVSVWFILFMVNILISPGISWHYHFIFIGFGLVTAVGGLMVFFLFPFLFPGFFSKEKWVRWKFFFSCFLMVFMISLGNTLFELYVAVPFIDFCFNETYMYQGFWHLWAKFIYTTFLIGIIPLTVFYFVIKNQGLWYSLREAEEMSRRLLKQKENTYHTEMEEKIILQGNTKEFLELLPKQLLYIEASGNYAEVCYLEEGDTKKKMIRATIRELEGQTPSFPEIVRCHRAFIVNLGQISNVGVTGQGYMFSIHHTTALVPVSRTYKKKIRESLEILQA